MTIASSIGQRERNEDAIGVDGWVTATAGPGPLVLACPVDAGTIFRLAVTDGLGSAPAGRDAAVLAAAALTSSPLDTAETPSITALFRHTDERIRASSTAETAGMGCTAALVVVSADGSTVIANCGDVRVYRLLDGYAGQLTEDHRSSTTTFEVTRCLGGLRPETAEPHVTRTTLRPGDRLVACTDGVHDAVGTSGIAAAANKGTGRSAVQNILGAVSRTGHSDNATVAVLDLARS